MNEYFVRRESLSGSGNEKGVRFGIYIPPDLAKELDEYMSKLGMASKSHQ